VCIMQVNGYCQVQGTEFSIEKAQRREMNHEKDLFHLFDQIKTCTKLPVVAHNKDLRASPPAHSGCTKERVRERKRSREPADQERARARKNELVCVLYQEQ